MKFETYFELINSESEALAKLKHKMNTIKEGSEMDSLLDQALGELGEEDFDFEGGDIEPEDWEKSVKSVTTETTPVSVPTSVSYSSNVSSSASKVSRMSVTSSRSMRNENSHKSFQITAFPDAVLPPLLQPETYGWDRKKIIMSWSAQFEDCPKTGKLHYHIFVQFKNKKVWENVRAEVARVIDNPSVDTIMPKPNNTIANARKASHKYCCRPDKRKVGTMPYTIGNAPRGTKGVTPPDKVTKQVPKLFKMSAKKQAANDLIDKYYEELSWEQLYIENQGLLRDDRSAKNYYDSLHKHRVNNMVSRQLENVIFYWGAAGSGKSTLAKAPDDYKTRSVNETQQQFRKRVWVQGTDMGDFWGAAGGESLTPDHEVIIVDEMGPKHKFTLNRFKEISNLGHHGSMVGTKNGCVRMNAKTMIFTSNVDPRYWFQDDFENRASGRDHWNAFKRRVVREEWVENPDGSHKLNEKGEKIAVLDAMGKQKTGWNVYHFPEYKPNGEKNLPKSWDEMYCVEDPLEDEFPHMANADGSAKKKFTMTDHFR
jgi:hypothetical protein